MNIESLSVGELQSVIAAATARIPQVRAEKAAEVRKQVESIVTANGLSMADVFGTVVVNGAKRGPAKGSKAPVKYRNPMNSSETWTGRGKLPRWIKASGKQAEAFRISA